MWWVVLIDYLIITLLLYVCVCVCGLVLCVIVPTPFITPTLLLPRKDSHYCIVIIIVCIPYYVCAPCVALCSDQCALYLLYYCVP